MAPEQAAGQAKQLTIAADIYSLGAILYESLAGHPPFVAESVPALLRKIVEEEVPTDPLKRASVQPALGSALQPSDLLPQRAVPKDLATIALKCLRKDPQARYRSAEALAEDLEHWLAGEPILARTAGAMERFRRWCRRKPLVAGLAATVVLLLLALLAGSLVSSARVAREGRRARLAEADARDKLWHSLLDQARAERRSGREGQHFRSLDAVAQAAAIRLSPGAPDRAAAELELRNEAIAALAMPDVRFTNVFPQPPAGTICFNQEVSLYTVNLPDGAISVRRLEDHSEIARLPAVGVAPQLLRGFSAGNHFFAVKYQNDDWRVWDLRSSETVLKDLRGGGGAFTPDGRTFVLSRHDGTTSVFTLDPAGEERRWRLGVNLRSLRFVPDGKRFAGVVEGNNMLPVFDLLSGEQVQALVHPATIGDFAWSTDGQWIATGCDNGEVFLWDARTGQQLARLDGHEDRVTRLGFNHANNLLATYSFDRSLRLWDAFSRRPLLTAEVNTLQTMFASDDRFMAYCLREGQAGLLEIVAGRAFRRLHGQLSGQRGSWGIDLSADGRLVAASNEDGARLWDFTRGEELAFLPIGRCRSVIFTPDGRHLITSGDAGLRRWPLRVTRHGGMDELRLGRAQAIGPPHPYAYASLSADGQRVAVASPDSAAAEIHDVKGGAGPSTFGPHQKILGVAISQDTRFLATTTWGGKGVKVWDVATQTLLRDLPLESSANAFFSPDHLLLLTGGDGYRVWELGAWRELYRVTDTEARLISNEAAFSPDGALIALVVRGNEIRLIEARSGRRLADFIAPQPRLLSGLRFSRDGTKLAALEWDQQVQVWDLRLIRRELAPLRLDWDAPPFPSASETPINNPPLVADLRPFTAEELAERIPARDPRASPKLVDLSALFNAPLTETWHSTRGLENSLSAVPRGVVTLAGVEFDLRGLVQLRSRTAPPLVHRYPERIEGIGIGRKVRRFHFLHATHRGAKPGETIGTYLVHYSDGRAETLPLDYGENIRDWWLYANETPDTANLSEAWHGTNAAASSNGAGIRLFKWTWDNPSPEKTIDRLDFAAGGTVSEPFLVAITAE